MISLLALIVKNAKIKIFSNFQIVKSYKIVKFTILAEWLKITKSHICEHYYKHKCKNFWVWQVDE
jgi:hypothetical protein